MDLTGLTAVGARAWAWLTAAAPDASRSPAAGGRLEGFDLAAALVRLGGDGQLLRSVLQQFALDLADWEPRLAAAMQSGDVPATRQLAHALKGAAATAGAESLRAAALALEAGLRNGSTTPGGALAQACLAELGLALAGLHKWLDSGASVATDPAAAPATPNESANLASRPS